MSDSSINSKVNTSIEVSIRLILLFIIIAWCLFLLLPFIEPVLWGVIIAVSVSPLYLKMNKRLGDKPKLSAAILVLAFLTLLIVPSYFVASSSAGKILEVKDLMEKGELAIPPPEASIKEWPIVGDDIYNIWNSFSTSLESALSNYEGQIANAVMKLIDAVAGLTGTVVLFFVSIIIAGILLASQGTNQLMDKLFVRLLGEKGSAYSELSQSSIRGVTKGVIGVAFIQAIILGIIFALAGVPYAAIWGVLVLILGIMQLPPSLISIPVVVYIFSVTDSGMATFWAVLILLAGFSDNVLKPMLMGKGAKVPMLVIFLGSIGGFMATGFLGLFTGAIVLSFGYELFMLWLNDSNAADPKPIVKD